MCEIIQRDNIKNTEVYVTTEAWQVKEKLSELIDGGLVAVLYDVKLKDYADNLARCFRGGNHLVLTTCLVEEIPDHARFIVGVGTGRIAGEVRKKATDLDIECALVFSAPTTDTILLPNGHKSFKCVFLDEGLINNCPKECVASGLGIILSEPLRSFEDYYADKVLDDNRSKDKTEVLSFENDRINLAYCLLELSSTRTYEDNATIMARVLFDSARKLGFETRLLGEYKFISASVIACLYESYLSSPSLDCALPPAHDQNLDALGKQTGRSLSKLLKAFDFFPIDDYFRVGYILSEYRLDLLEKLRAVDFHSAQKKWRRVYSDAGYWLKSAFTTSSLLTAMRLSAEIGHGLLRFISESGFTEAC